MYKCKEQPFLCTGFQFQDSRLQTHEGISSSEIKLGWIVVNNSIQKNCDDDNDSDIIYNITTAAMAKQLVKRLEVKC